MPTHAYAPTAEQSPAFSRSYVKKLVYAYGGKHARSMMDTLDCETDYQSPEIQSYRRYSDNYPQWNVQKGEREKSFGVAQFHIPSQNRGYDGRVITRELASDPEYAIKSMAYHFKSGNAHLWSCYDNRQEQL